MGGELVRAPKLRVGYFAQHQIEELVPEQSAVQHLARRLPDEREERLRTRLGGFGLSQDKADLPAARLSGGEKARLTFALMSALAPQILILDEPTNHLDIESREALVEAINDFAGAVILISHDRHLIELTADRLWLVADGRVRPFDGDIDSYRQGLLGRGRGNGADESGKRSERQRGAEQRQRLAPLRQAARQAERELERLTRDRSVLAARLANSATYRLPGPELEALAKRNAELEAAIAAAEARWLEAEQALEQA
jgi:ATP-binding cassette subfamily F protein 3